MHLRRINYDFQLLNSDTESCAIEEKLTLLSHTFTTLLLLNRLAKCVYTAHRLDSSMAGFMLFCNRDLSSIPIPTEDGAIHSGINTAFNVDQFNQHLNKEITNRNEPTGVPIFNRGRQSMFGLQWGPGISKYYNKN